MAHKLRQCTGDQDITEYPPAPTGDLWGRSRYGQRLYLELLAEMAIDDAFLREVVPGSGVLRGAALVFRTDWRRFAPPGYDLGHALWRAWHPYFMRPFLTASAVSYLVEEGVRGIASDVDDMDCPLRERYRAPRQDHVPPELLHFWSVVDEGIALDWATDEDVEARFASLHRAMREGHVFVVENLRIPPELTDPIHYEGEPSPTGQMVIRGRLHLQPMPWTANSGSVPVQALFRPGVPGGREE